MKHMKKLVGLLLTVVMVFAMTTMAFAADQKFTIKNENDNHSYEVYQIFTGDLSEKILSNIKWGQNGTGTEGEKVDKAILDALVAVKDKTDTEKLAVIKNYADLTADAYGTIEGAGSLTDVPAGYYLIKDVDGSQDGQNDAYTTYITKIVGDVTITPKSAKPTVDKEVLDEAADAENGAADGWGETADHAINETFQFKLTANIPDDDDLDDYATYKLVFKDTMSAGVTFESIASVKINNTPITDYVLSENAVNGAAEITWTLTINDLKSYGVDIKGATVEVIYNAHLNEAAEIGNIDENTNKVKLEYSNNPNAEGTGETAEDTVWVFTYEMPNTKVDGSNENKPLAGAGFKLYDSTGTTEIGLIYDETLQAYRPVKDGETAEEMFSADGTGIFNIKGLDAGTYVLKETTTPPGYNTCADITIVISATHEEGGDGTTASTTITMKQDGKDSTNNIIVNNKGTELPETGGMGTTIFYVLGAILVLGSAIALITKKRMDGHQ